MSDEKKTLRELLLMIKSMIEEIDAPASASITENDPNEVWSRETAEFLDEEDYER